MTEYRLLKEFRGLFENTKYEHRRSNLGDFVAMHLYEDLLTIQKSERYTQAVTSMSRVLNGQNKRRGINARRGDGTFGELILGEEPQNDPGFAVARGPVATVEIGVEVKILSKAMIKQIDRVKSDLAHQVQNFKHRAGSSRPICVAVIGINYAAVTTSYEGERSYRTDGGKFKHTIQEAEQARTRLLDVVSMYDEFIIFKYRVSNEPPYRFEWVNPKEVQLDYGAALIRISNEYQKTLLTFNPSSIQGQEVQFHGIDQRFEPLQQRLVRRMGDVGFECRFAGEPHDSGKGVPLAVRGLIRSHVQLQQS